MSKIIRLSESELIKIVKRIVESDDDIRMKRRYNRLQDLINDEIQSGDQSGYSDEFEYADNILSTVVERFINETGNEFMEDRYDDVLDYTRQEFGDDILESFAYFDVEEDDELNDTLYEDTFGSVQSVNYNKKFMNEAEYQGRKVQLGKIMQGDVKKFKVYVKNGQGKVVKVNFGFGGKSAKGKRMVIKKNNPARRKSFRARMNCDNPGPRWKPRYWACKSW